MGDDLIVRIWQATNYRAAFAFRLPWRGLQVPLCARPHHQRGRRGHQQGQQAERDERPALGDHRRQHAAADGAGGLSGGTERDQERDHPGPLGRLGVADDARAVEHQREPVEHAQQRESRTPPARCRARRRRSWRSRRSRPAPAGRRSARIGAIRPPGCPQPGPAHPGPAAARPRSVRHGTSRAAAAPAPPAPRRSRKWRSSSRSRSATAPARHGYEPAWCAQTPWQCRSWSDREPSGARRRPAPRSSRPGSRRPGTRRCSSPSARSAPIVATRKPPTSSPRNVIVWSTEPSAPFAASRSSSATSIGTAAVASGRNTPTPIPPSAARATTAQGVEISASAANTAALPMSQITRLRRTRSRFSRSPTRNPISTDGRELGEQQGRHPGR